MDIIFQLDLHATELCRLCHTWRTKVQSIPGSEDLDSWGPSEQELLEAAIWKVTANWNNADESNAGHDDGDTSEEADWDDMVDDDDDFDLFESLETVAFVDEYRGVGTDHIVYEDADYSASLHSRRNGSRSPNKRPREL